MKLRWGIIGCGKISTAFVKALQYLPQTEHQVVCVASQSLERAETFKKSLELEANSYGTYQELYANPDVDVVYIGNENNQHLSTTLGALKAGKHVLCEKPLGVNRAQVQSMMTAAKEAGKLLMEGFWSRCFPIYEDVRQELAKGTIGKPLYITGVFGGYGERLLRPEVSGSPLMYLGCYLIQFATLVFGNARPNIRSADAKMKHGVEETLGFLLEWEGGEWAQFLTSSAQLGGSVTVYGEKGTLRIPENFHCPFVLEVAGERRERAHPPGGDILGNQAGFQYEAAAVRDAIIEGEQECSLVSWEDSLAVVGIMDAIRQHIGVRFPEDAQ